jgi:hypothetical protein
MLNRLKNLLSSKAAAEEAPPASDAVLANAYCTVAAPPPIDFPHVLNASRDLSDPELARHLGGFSGYVQSLGDGQMTQVRYHVLRHIQRVNRHLSLSFDASQSNAFAQWAAAANAIVFLPDGSLRDPWGRTLLDAAGQSDPQAEVPYPRAAWDRKARSDTLLEARGVRVPGSLPPLVDESELRLRGAGEAAGRAMALLLVAARAESLNSGAPLPIEQLRARCPQGFDHLSPKEREFLAQALPSQEAIVQFAWRYEALACLEWALGWVDELPFPGAICDVPRTVGVILEADPAALLRGARLRAPGELLDALDLHYRLHWAVRQAQVDQREGPAGVDGGVVLERHYALNWLVRFEESEWDEVDTPT